MIGEGNFLLCNGDFYLTMVLKKIRTTRDGTFLQLFPEEEFGVGSGHFEYIFWPKSNFSHQDLSGKTQ